MTEYPWPVQPFDRQHAVRGFFRDPRIGDAGGKSFHTGVDVSAPDGTAVYAVAPGRVSIEGAQIVAVIASGRNFGYWHIVPSVENDSEVPLHGLLGHIAPGWGHVHLAERTPNPGPHGSYWNPLRAGALTPFADHGPPVVSRIVTSLPPTQLFGLVNFMVEAFDHPPISAPPPWHDIPVTPALVRWRLVHGPNEIVPWRIAADSVHRLPQTSSATPISISATSTRRAPARTTQTSPGSSGSGSRAASTPARTPMGATASK